MKTTSFITAIVSAIILFSSCAQSRFDNQRTFVSSYSSVENQAMANIFYRQSPKTSVQLFGDQSAIDNISMKVKNGALCIDSNADCVRNNTKKVDIYISSPQLNRIVLNGKGAFALEGTVEGNTLFIESNGIGNFSADNLLYEHIIVESEGVGNITLSGKTNSLQIISDGVGMIRTDNLRAITALTTSNGVGNIYCTASKAVDLTANGVGNIFYSGEPALKNIVRNGVGDVLQTRNLSGL